MATRLLKFGRPTKSFGLVGQLATVAVAVMAWRKFMPGLRRYVRIKMM